MNMPGPSEGHRFFERMSGTWEGEETMHPSAWDPVGGIATGRNENKIDLSGFVLITDYEQERGGTVTFTGHGVYTYSPKEDCYTLHWFDCLGSPPEVFVGSLERNVLTLGHGGPGMHARMSYDLSTEGVMKGTMEMSPDGVEWDLLFEAVYRRA